ncbi:ornithine cyclodeaminase family protein [Streptomyces inhibens]|uniref:ornithine cyclodeaminase family protein n=1 Tax=Streptomyces inhibens TaxID=2293571 RepID=UPI001EE78018|nr:ornithine cyclodeaminase family protein [Streptomyces inhibens]UKY54075.1 ornithine cyclodeaminase family protein [Streptomyces inhibens]
MTRILTHRDLIEVLDPRGCLEALREGFRRVDAAAIPGQRVRTDLPFDGTATALIPGLLPGIDAYTVKVNAKFPGAGPALRGVICLHSGRDGELLALVDSATITAWRTGLGAALGTHLLAAPDPHGAAALGIIGAGAQAELTVRGLREMRRWGELIVHDTDPQRAAEFAARHHGTTADSAAEVASRAQILLLATWSRQPLLGLADIRPGRHLTALGADEPGKQELTSELLEAALLTVDDRHLAATTGALANAGLPADAADATLSEILRQRHPGRTHPDQITVYAPVGLPWQDLALTWTAHGEAERRGLGTTVDLLA